MMACGREMMGRILDIVVLAALSISCSELIDPRQEAVELRSDGTAALADGDCLRGLCDLEWLGTSAYCICSLDGITAGGGGSPPSHPINWPEPPGVYWSWDTGGGGGWRSPGGGSGDTCDPTQDDPPCVDFEVTLECPVGIERGETGTCTVGEPQVPVAVVKWYFKGATIENTSAENSRTWSGTMIESGDVRADIIINGNPAVVESRIEVVPRTSGKFTQSAWQAQMSFEELKGKLDCGGKRPHFGKPIGWSGSLKSAQDGLCEGHVIDPYRATAGGYDVEIVPNGPNKGGIYIKNPKWYYKGTSQIHPGRDIAYPLADSVQAHLCKGRAGTTTVSFNTFNAVCKRVSGWVNGFWPAVKRHERQHWENGRLELVKSGNNMYTETEHCVGGDASHNYPDFNKCVTDEHIRIQDAMRARTAPEPTGFWNTVPWWLWMTDAGGPNVFRAADRKF